MTDLCPILTLGAVSVAALVWIAWQVWHDDRDDGGEW